jgi:hypothetical protein
LVGAHQRVPELKLVSRPVSKVAQNLRARAFTLRGASFLILFLRGGVYGAVLRSLNNFRIDCRKLFHFSRSGNSTTTTTRRRRRDVALSNDDCLAVLCRVRRHDRTRRRWLARSAFNSITVVFVHGINDVTLFPRYVNKVCARRAFVVRAPSFVLAAIRSGSIIRPRALLFRHALRDRPFARRRRRRRRVGSNVPVDVIRTRRLSDHRDVNRLGVARDDIRRGSSFDITLAVGRIQLRTI